MQSRSIPSSIEQPLSKLYNINAYEADISTFDFMSTAEYRLHPFPMERTMPTTTAAVSRYFSEFQLKDAPSEVRHEAKRILLDTLGCLAGGRSCEIAPTSDKLALLLGQRLASGGSTLIGQGNTTLISAVYGNARIANALDFDETFPVGVHFGVAAVAVALAMAEERGASGADVLRAVIVGYELGARIATYIGPMTEVVDGQVKGFSKVWGVAAPVVLAAMGAAAAIARLDERQFAQAVGLAVSNSPLPAGALWSNAVDLPNCKYCDAGWCAVAGVFAVLSVEAGSTGFTDALDGPYGLARMCGVQTFDERSLTEGLGKTWLIANVTYKPWPTCRFTHYPLTSLDRILRRENIAPGEIEEVVIETGPMAASARFTKPLPRTFASRSFSYPHMAAMLIRGVAPGPKWLDAESVTDPDTLSIAEKVRVVAHERGNDFARTMEANQIRTMPGGVLVRTTRGDFHDEDDFALGDPWSEQSRLSDADLTEKFLGMSGSGAGDLVGRIFSIEREPSVHALMQRLNECLEGAV